MSACMRCGREIPDDQVFCQDCLKDMARYPVDPNIVVQLPIRKNPSIGKKTPRRRSPSPEEQVLSLKRRIRILGIVTVLLFGLSLGLTIYTIRLNARYRLRPGQNYTSVVSTLPPVSTGATEAVTAP